MANETLINRDGLAYSESYARAMETVILPYIRENGTDMTVPGYEGRPLHAVRCDAPSPKGTVVIVHGFTESALKFSEIIYSLVKNGYSVLAYDQRGHGLSWRKDGLEGTYATHVDKFEEYVQDLEILSDTVLKGMPKPYSLLSHSMGGAVAALFLEKRQDVFERAFLCSPMIAPNRSGVPLAVAKAMCAGGIRLGKGDKISPLSKPFSGHEDFAAACSTGRARFDWYDDIRVAHPEYQNCAPTINWTLEALKVTEKILAPGAVERISALTIVFSAELDTVVLAEPQRDFAYRLKRGGLTVVQGAKHEIYRSEDAVLFPWWQSVLAEL